jgi:CheY-like chemotaxis protein
MVLGFVEQSGGHVTVSSEPGEGASLRLYLPPSGARPAQGLPEQSPDVATADSSLILVVEDDEDLRSMTRMLLSDVGYRVLEARSGRDALALLKTKTEVDLVLTDVVLPDGMNGPQMVREARRSNALLKAIYMSGYAGAALARRGGLADDEVLVQKPFEPTDLERIVGDALTGG